MRTLLNFWLDLTLLVSFLAGLWTMFVIRIAFPPPTNADGWMLWGLTLNGWWDLQFWLICIFAFSVLLHVMLHWSWICGVITSRILRQADGGKRQWNDGERTLYGVGLLVVILHVLGIGVFAATLAIQGP